MKILLLMAFTCLGVSTQAQFGKDFLNKVKESTKRKVDNKIDQKTNEGIDKAVDAPEKAVKNKRNKKAAATDQATPVPGDEVITATESNGSNNAMEGEGAQTVIQTNITCEAGKKKIETLLKKQEGVFEVKTNIKNGELAIRYSSDGTSYTSILQLINEQGFEADGNKPSAGAPSNPCKKK